MKCPEAPAQQAGDESTPLAGVYPAPSHPEGVVWETSPTGEASSSKVISQAGRFGLHKHSYLCCPDKRQILGQTGFATTQKGKRAQSLKTAGLEKVSPRNHTTK